MRVGNIIVVLFLILAIGVSPAWAQKSKTKSQKPPERREVSARKSDTQGLNSENEKRVRDILDFLQFVLNTLGSKNTPARDKDVLITESYTKIFRDDKVQVEDDLVEKRDVITNKDVVAYLKDVDFFFTDVKFEIQVESITESTLPNGDLFYKVSAIRNLSGTTADGQPINTTQPRFIELNLDREEQDLKIVSIYTHQFDEKKALQYWWSSLSYEWRSIFKKRFQLGDSVSLADIAKVTAITDLDLSGNRFIQNIEPLSQLYALRELNLSQTDVSDLSPIRNLTALIDFNISQTKVFDLSPLRYATRLQTLDISNTEINDLSVLERMSSLKELSLAHTPVYSFDFLASLSSLEKLNLEGTQIAHLLHAEKLTALKVLNLSKTLIQDLSTVGKFAMLEELLIDSTTVSELQPLSTAVNLKSLSANYTYISSLEPLTALKNLDRIYCDQTSIDRNNADQFISKNPGVLIIYDSKDLQAWWRSIPADWQQVLSKSARWSESDVNNASPPKEALARVTNLDSIDLSGDITISDIEPLRRLLKLQKIRLFGTSITDISPLENHRDVQVLDVSGTSIKDLFVIRQFDKLKALHANNTQIENVDPLLGLTSLKEVHVDNTNINDVHAQEFLTRNPDCLLVYKSDHLRNWWKTISPQWKESFQRIMKTDSVVTNEKLHWLIEQPGIVIQDISIRELDPLSEFVNLTSLQLNGTGINRIPPLDNLKRLKRLVLSNGPLRNIDFIQQMNALEVLDISNTPVEDLKPLTGLQSLTMLHCGGTQIKKLDPVRTLESLQSFDCSNTRVTSINDLERLNLKVLKCYNTNVSRKKVDKFKQKNPECQVIFY